MGDENVSADARNLSDVVHVIREAAREVSMFSEHYADLLDAIAGVAENEAAGGEV